jgi:predicted permease
MQLLWAALSLAAPVVLGAVAGATRLFPSPEGTIASLNRYALYIAFPPLVAQGLLASELSFPSSPGFWLLIPTVLAATALSGRLLLPRHAPTLALILAFGNVAYLGLPIVEQVLGPTAMPVASLAVAMHILFATTAGPLLLLRWSHTHGRGAASVLGRVLRQPLLWAPSLALAARSLPSPAREALATVITPIGRSAAPVALFLLGLYLHTHRDRARRLDVGDAVHVAWKVVLMPALTLGLCLALRHAEAIGVVEARVLTVLSAMPAAVTTFVMAHEYGVGAERTSRAVVATSLASLLAIPLTVWAALRWIA